jgi:hypothetical protein
MVKPFLFWRSREEYKLPVTGRRIESLSTRAIAITDDPFFGTLTAELTAARGSGLYLASRLARLLLQLAR